MNENEELDKEITADRKRNFRVEVTPLRWPSEPGEVNLSITRNGAHWQSISLLRGEVEQVINELRKAAM